MIQTITNNSKTLGGLMALAMVGSANAALIGHWAFDEGTGTTTADSSGNGNTGVFAGGVTWGTGGPGGNYAVFDGAVGSAVNPGVNLPIMTTSNDFTWAFWVNSGAPISGTQQNANILGNRRDGSNADLPSTANRQFIKFTPTKFEWHQNANGNDNQEYDDLVVGEWHHIAVVKTGTSVQLYRDGVATGGPGTLTEDLSTAVAMPLFIGGDVGNTNANEFFTGSIDDVRIYNNALTSGEVGALAGIPEPSSLLLGALSLGMMLRRKR